MKVKTLTCNNIFEAEALHSLMAEQGLPCEIYDEKNSKLARGILDATVQVLVRDTDWSTAERLYAELLEDQKSTSATD